LNALAIVIRAPLTPFIGKITALLWFHGVNRATGFGQKDTAMIRVLPENRMIIRPIAILLHEFIRAEFKVLCHGANVFTGQKDITGRLAAQITALTLKFLPNLF